MQFSHYDNDSDTYLFTRKTDYDGMFFSKHNIVLKKFLLLLNNQRPYANIRVNATKSRIINRNESTRLFD